MSVIKWLDKNIEKYILLFLLVCMVGIMSYAVMMRYVFNAPPFWANTLTQYCFVISTFFSISYCIRRGTSLRIDILFHYLPKKITRILSVVSYLISLVLFSFFTYVTFFVIESFVQSGATEPTFGWSMYAFYIFVFSGFFLASVRCIQAIWFEFFPEKNKEDTSVKLGDLSEAPEKLTDLTN